MTAIAASLARFLLYVVAYFWFLGALPLVAYAQHRLRSAAPRWRSAGQVAAFVAWMAFGYGIYTYVLPQSINPFCTTKACKVADD